MFQNLAPNAETIEACKIKLAWLDASLEEEAAPDEKTAARNDILREMSRLHLKMGDLYLARQEPALAAECYQTSLNINPRQLAARMNLLKTIPGVTREDVLKSFLQGLLLEKPNDSSLYNKLGRVHFSIHETDLALQCFQRAVEINPQDADSMYGLADIVQALGDIELATEYYRKAMMIQPIVHGPASQPTPDLSVLVFMAPLLGNTPVNYLMNSTSYERNICPLFEDTVCDIELLKKSGHVILNTVSEADLCDAILPKVIDLVDRLDLPIINHPRKIQKTTRENILGVLEHIPNCRFGRVARHVAGEPATAEALAAKIPFALPVLARPTGTHGGERFEKIESFEALAEFISQNPDADHYMIEYVDYKSADNHFRKYRFFFVDGNIMPYHLAIGDHWKVHHNTTSMGDHQWMQDEEKAFLQNPQGVFSAKNYEALRAIGEAVGLEYFGVDCGLDREGNLVVFEVNASMIVHPYNEAFPYKTPFVENIKRAFRAMLQKFAKVTTH